MNRSDREETLLWSLVLAGLAGYAVVLYSAFSR